MDFFFAASLYQEILQVRSGRVILNLQTLLTMGEVRNIGFDQSLQFAETADGNSS